MINAVASESLKISLSYLCFEGDSRWTAFSSTALKTVAVLPSHMILDEKYGRPRPSASVCNTQAVQVVLRTNFAQTAEARPLEEEPWARWRGGGGHVTV